MTHLWSNPGGYVWGSPSVATYSPMYITDVAIHVTCIRMREWEYIELIHNGGEQVKFNVILYPYSNWQERMTTQFTRRGYFRTRTVDDRAWRRVCAVKHSVAAYHDLLVPWFP